MICSAVKITQSGISQLKGGDIVSTIPKEEIKEISLSYDSRSRHPFLQFLAGFVLIVTGIILIITAFMIRARIFTIWLLVGAGLWLLVGVFRGRYNFLIQTEKGVKKIFFEEKTDIRDIHRFVSRANSELGYNIDLSIMDTVYFKTC